MDGSAGICEVCGAAFVAIHKDKKLCSKRCASTRFNRARAEAKRLSDPRPAAGHCKFCAKEFAVGPKGRVQIFCSELCTQKQWALDHPDTVKERRKRTYAKHGDSIRAKSAEYGRAHREETKARNRIWSKTEKGVLGGKSKLHRRRARKLNAGGSFTRTEFKALCTATGNRCLCCGQAVGLAKLTADHIVALANGGHNGIGNIQPLCQPCNTAKGVETINYFIPYALEGMVIYAPAEYAPQLTAA